MELDYAGSSNSKPYNKGNWRKPQQQSQSQPKGLCHSCQKPGHFWRDCPLKGKGKFTNIEDSTSNSTLPPDYNNLELTNAEGNKKKLLRINGKINGHNAWILLDSGAS